jgi:hypothetical protein
MSSNIWTQCAGPSRFVPYSCEVWRVVEGQHVTSTRKLVDSSAEHDLLEWLIEEHKPRLPNECEGRHYLLSTPFRYPPLRYGSRFASRTERSLFYAAEEVTTALGETAFYRLWFLEDSTADLAPLESDFTAFRVKVKCEHSIDLTALPFSAFSTRLSSQNAFADAQALGKEMRGAGVEVFRYSSARQPNGVCVGIFCCDAFASGPMGEQHWRCFADRDSVEFVWPLQRARHIFPREQFLHAGELAPRPS